MELPSESVEALPASSSERLKNTANSRAWRLMNDSATGGAKYGYIPTMIVPIVLVIVTAVQVNSQELCPSVCRCYSEKATCTDLFSDVTHMTQHRFSCGLRLLRVTWRTNLEGEDLFLRWNITSLIYLNLSQNNITKIWQRAFYSLADLEELYLSGHNITTLDSQKFYFNKRLQKPSLSRNGITFILQSTFQKNVWLNYINVNFNKLTSLDPDLFKNNVELVVVSLSYNRITDIHRSTFRNNNRLRHLDISGNKITLINPDTFIHNRELTFLYLQRNNIQKSATHHFADSNNWKSWTFRITTLRNWILLYPQHFIQYKPTKSPSVEAETPQPASKYDTAFNFEFYFPMIGNSGRSTPTFQLDYLNVSSNRLTTLDVASVKWLIQTTAVTDLTPNPWNCDCSLLLEVWRGLKHKLTLHCASPRELQGNSWDVIEKFCSLVGGPSVVTITLILIGVLLVCAIDGGIILVIVVKRRRNKPKTPEYCDVHASRASYVSIHSNAEIGARPSYVAVQSYTDVDSDSRNATGYSDVAVQ